MSEMRNLYEHLEDRIQDLSRVNYAVLVGLSSAVGLLAVSAVINESMTDSAVMLGIAMALVYYWFNPTQKD